MSQLINVVGAGFSGLATAYFLNRAGRHVRVFEKSNRAGGLIQTIRTEHGLVETAANGLLNSARLEAMCADIGVPLLPTRSEGRRRFIYRDKPRQLPLHAGEVARAGFSFAKNLASLRPLQFESIAAWGRRVFGKGATEYLLIPALGGIYAGDPARLSASLIFGRADLPDHLQSYRKAKGKVRGTVAPPEGMQQLIDGLGSYLEKEGVEFLFSQEGPPPADEPTIVCLSAPAAAKYLTDFAPELSEHLEQIEMISLVTVTCFYDSAPSLEGFGCLFPGDQGFRARGVLLNNSIFAGRGPAHSETWIFGGAMDPDISRLDDAELSGVISHDRARLFGRVDAPLALHITRRPNALPHYSVELERILRTLPRLPQNVALVGNYLGRIGLTKILERAAYVVDHLE
ncbi:MAG TPA: FAD-dependent oxidoreductase [Pyrinomonadaceae bacterium]|nr:FAD-dependent oxidoreductase [Pyrinomonadaceae bacterium]